MPVPVTSRYHGLTPVEAPARDGSRRPAVPVRFAPDPAAGPGDLLHTVVAGDTIDRLAARYLGSSEAWWQLADANPAMFPAVFPAELVPGTVLVIPAGPPTGRIERTRAF
ncbi:hypothetical protein GCM10010156_40810 [Planobispora rosea]|uniref:LysM domain-containing protein n=1 Tax=Planobispora rosea TaxID=35762 RepID=A0A8J3WE74_PLARO|nr:LysM domain-containing protein [Planobispora rosea]GGS77849.1 hypothetical protein GCM10010156_40810 [Planobispora rosea]GIH85607.1 hypothetical protein Pro02_40150 [Planobispora rosea]